MKGWSCYLLLLLSACAGRAQDRPVALTGTVLTPDEVIQDGTVLFQHGVVLAVGSQVSLPAGTLTVATEGIIAPGLIDLHNHLTWNVLPRWKPNEEFGSRYDWQAKPAYKVLMDGPHKALVAEGLECDAERYAEVKALAQGETSAVGSMHLPCSSGLIRRLDSDPELPGGIQAKVLYNVFPLQMTEEDVAGAQKTLQNGGALLIHLAEGAPNSASAAREFPMLKARGLLLPGVSFIHAVALTADDFQQVHDAGVGFIWSPHSNIELYGATADVADAKRLQVTIAIAPDWSPTGSDGMLAELKYAAAWNISQAHPLFDDRALVDTATVNPARLVHLETVLGQLSKGYTADVLVLRRPDRLAGKDDWSTLLHASPKDVQLVIVQGNAVYGDTRLMHQVTGDSELETVEVCGTEKSLSFTHHATTAQPTFRQTQVRLAASLRAWGRTLAPVAECGD